jgi:multicomponent Na+:H+ antiporter subunit E
MMASIVARIPVIATLTILWMLLWGGITPLLAVGGVLVGLLVTTVFPFPPVGWKGHVRPWAVVRLVAIFVVDLLAASLQVAWIAVRPSAPPRSAVIRVDMVTRSELLLTLTVELVSLVPGSLLIELDSEHGHVWLHLLDGSTPEKIERARSRALAQERRVIEALGSRAELTACRGEAS